MSKPFQANAHDLAIIKSLQSDQNQEALLQLLTDGFKKPVFAMVEDNSGNHGDAEELYNEVLYILTKNVNRKGFELTARLSTYIYAIAYHQWLKELEKRRKREALRKMLRENPEVIIEENHVLTLYRKILEECLNGLDKRKDSKCKELIQATEIDRLSQAEAAELLDFKNPNNVKTQKSLCMKRLKQCCHEKLKDISHDK